MFVPINSFLLLLAWHLLLLAWHLLLLVTGGHVLPMFVLM